MDGDINDLTPEAIAAMEAGDLIRYAVDAFDYEPLVRAPILALMRLRARQVKAEDILADVLKVYEQTEKKNSAQYAKELAARNTLIPLDYDEKGKPLKSINNFLRVMRSDPFYSGLKFNLLTNSPETEEDEGTKRWVDADDARSRWFMETQYGIHNRDKHEDALKQVFKERAYHPVREIIESVAWDGVERISGFLCRWMKCEDTPYTREVSRLIFAGGIHRVYNPGCKFDDMAVLIGIQGSGKSTLVQWLAMKDRFYREVTEFEGQRGMEALDGAWICEVGELLALTKAKEQEAIKSYLTRQVDTYRKSYDRRVSENSRQCIFIGTTNKEQFLTDKTGGRRFYPVRCESNGYWLYDHEQEIKAEIEQCWAEALFKMLKGAMLPYADRGLTSQIKVEQEEAQEDDYRVGMIAKYLNGRNTVCGIELWEEALNLKHMNPTQRDFMDLRLIMQGMEGWERSRERLYTDKYGRQRIWTRKKIDLGPGKGFLQYVSDDGEEMPF